MNQVISERSFRLLMNPKPVRSEGYAKRGRSKILCLSDLARAKQEITSWPGYETTALRSLDGIARAIGIKAIFYKDEGARFGLGSFKALGGAYAVATILQNEVHRQTGVNPSSSDLSDGKFRSITSKLTVACATDGNHGRSVAWGASMFGCRCIIYVHAHVSQARRDAIEAYGAEVRAVHGSYDDSVHQVARDAAQHDWRIVSDTSYEGYTDIPRKVMQGYGVMTDEIFAQMPRDSFPTHVFIQGGVGGLAASICSYLWQKFDEKAPSIFVAEPDKAPCILVSAEAGRPTTVKGDLNTIMAGLACGEVSLLAWSILERGVDGFLSVSDESAAETMKLLADAPFRDIPVVAGESAVAGLTGLLLAARDDDARRQVRLDENSIILLIGTEGATDPSVYENLVDRNPDEVSGAAKLASTARRVS
jgi:diaminopropionate ammonia-lyase